ncbi:MAG: uncharacterized protein A8A55_1924 [Amphiamblys sp. WSBS2006]|nr:MAG: uncharacterized protein A8A55_1924 [Amphiamblys sp. WSBS2006]
MRIREDWKVEWFRLCAREKERVSEILAQEQTICVGRVKSIDLEEYAVSILPKLRFHEDCEVEWLILEASEEEHVSEILAQNQKIYVGRVKSIGLEEYAVSILPKLEIHEDCRIEWLRLVANRKEYVEPILAQSKPIYVGAVKNASLGGYAVSILPRLRIHGDNIMEEFILSAAEEQIPDILEEGDSNIELGRIRLGGFHVPEEVRRKLRYTLVDGEGKEVLEGERKRRRSTRSN